MRSERLSEISSFLNATSKRQRNITREEKKIILSTLTGPVAGPRVL
jgi:hypothetical protein